MNDEDGLTEKSGHKSDDVVGVRIMQTLIIYLLGVVCRRRKEQSKAVGVSTTVFLPHVGLCPLCDCSSSCCFFPVLD